MGILKPIKLYFSIALISIGLCAGMIALLYILGVALPNQAGALLVREGGTLFGILTFSGGWILSSIKD